MTEFTYAAVTNIPNEFRTADLRAHFSTFVENGSFICFHYRHRPEKISKEKETTKSSKLKSNSNSSSSNSKFCCCVIKIRMSRFDEFTERYNNEQWTDVSNNYSIQRCNISQIKIFRGTVSSDSPTPTPIDSSDHIQENTLLTMPELKPPELMPNGNVGTPTHVFLDYIQRCLLPDRLIHTLKLRFPKTEGKRLYSNVNYEYTDHRIDSSGKRKFVPNGSYSSSKRNKKQSSNLDISQNSEICERDNRAIENLDVSLRDKTIYSHQTNLNSAMNSDVDIQGSLTKRELKKLKKLKRKEMTQLMSENIEEHLIDIERKYHNDEDAEEWDRHEAIENDPSNQERNKERLYEEEIEQPWEKGGPGVVFYTDAMFWQAREGDFDEQTADDLDVDFSPYEGDGPGDKDIRDFLKIRQEGRFRSGYDKTDRFSIGLSTRPVPDDTPTSFSSLPLPGPSLFKKPINKTIGQFEIHTKGMGRKILEKQGWKDGQGLGKNQSGMKQALKGEGQRPHKKKGLGFVKTEQVCCGLVKVKKSGSSGSHFITTSLDNPQETDPKEKLLERQEPTTLKHRKSSIYSP